jgi:ABC-type multidrug transport system fused ATPase/permease subunit
MTRFLYSNLKGRRLIVGVAIVLTFVGVSSDILMAFPLKFILDKIVHHQDPVVPVFGSIISRLDHFGTRNGLNDTEVHTQLGVILFAGTMALTLAIIGAVVSFVQLAVAAFVAQDLGAKLRARLFVHVEHLPLEWHGRQRVGDIVQRISGNVTDVEKLVTEGLVDLLSGILTLVGILVVMLLLNWQFTLLSMVIVPPLFLVVASYTRWIKRASKETSRAAGQVAEVATEGVGAIAELKAFTLEGWAARTFADRVERQRASGARAGRRQAEFNPLVLMLIALTTVAIISVGAWIAFGHGHRYSLWILTIPAGSLTIGTLTVFLTYSKQLYQPMRNLSKLMLLASTGASAAERIQEVLDQPWEEREPAEPYAGPSELRGSVVYQGVVFGYEEGRPVLHGIDLEVPTGRRVALVGLSGSGKTTLVRLLPRFYDRWEGTITVDGVDINAYPRDILRRNIGFVLQDSVLFEGTIRENIVLDREDATEEQVVAAAKDACIHDTILSTPGGYDAQVREHGKNFSSGQRQRIAIARAFLRDAPILILDEPTANLDVEAEAEVMRAIERLTEGRTVIVISHRLSTLGHVDEIAVLEAGRIVERGSYQQLKASGGTFARLLVSQNRYAAEPIPIPIVGDGQLPAPVTSPRAVAGASRHDDLTPAKVDARAGAPLEALCARPGATEPARSRRENLYLEAHADLPWAPTTPTTASEGASPRRSQVAIGAAALAVTVLGTALVWPRLAPGGGRPVLGHGVVAAATHRLVLGAPAAAATRAPTPTTTIAPAPLATTLPLNDLLVDAPPAGYAQLSAGQGPQGAFDLAGFLRYSEQTSADMVTFSAHGFAAGFVRSWERAVPRGSARILAAVFEFHSGEGAAAVQDYETTRALQAGGTLFAVSGATGLRFAQGTGAQRVYGYSATFLKSGGLLFYLTAIYRDDEPPAEILGLVRAQQAWLATAGPGPRA